MHITYIYSKYTFSLFCVFLESDTSNNPITTDMDNDESTKKSTFPLDPNTTDIDNDESTEKSTFPDDHNGNYQSG